jgi:transposase
MRPLSISEREKIIKHHKNGESTKNISKWLFIARSTVYKIISIFSKNMDIKPKPYTGNNRKITAEQEEKILQRYAEIPDSTLNETIDELNLTVTESGLSRYMKKHGLSFKKRHFIQMGKNVKMF